jgi:hypothetical protein
MPSRPSALTRRRTPLAMAVAIAALLLAACAPAAGSASQMPTAPASPSTAGPTDFAAWTARQGFGGSSGLNEVHKYVAWVGDNPGEVTAGLVDVEATPVVDSLAAWLDAHPATACWAAYRDAVRANLATIQDGYAAIRSAVAAGKAMPVDIQARMEQAGREALDRPEPAGCP